MTFRGEYFYAWLTHNIFETHTFLFPPNDNNYYYNINNNNNNYIIDLNLNPNPNPNPIIIHNTT